MSSSAPRVKLYLSSFKSLTAHWTPTNTTEQCNVQQRNTHHFSFCPVLHYPINNESFSTYTHPYNNQRRRIIWLSSFCQWALRLVSQRLNSGCVQADILLQIVYLLIASCCLIAMLHVNEEAEILSRLGALTSDLEIQHKSLKKKRISFGFIFRNLKAVESCASTDDEENDSNVVYGISTSIQGITMPNMVLNIHTNNSLFVISVFCITAIGFLAGCFTGGLIVLCDSGFGTRAVFAVHALFATGIFVMSLLSTFILSGVAVPYSHFSKLPSDHNVFNRLLVKRAMNLLSVQSDDDVFVKSSVLKKRTTLQSLRPDHVVGVESIAEPKTQENLQKRKEAVERIKSKEEKLSLIANDFIHSSGYSDVQERARNQNNFTHSNTSAAYVNMFSASSSHPRKKDKGTAKAWIMPKRQLLNWNIGTITFSTFWILENLDQEFGPFQNVHMVYALATFFGLCCLSLCFVAAICNGSCIAISSLQDVELNGLLEKEEKSTSPLNFSALSPSIFKSIDGLEENGSLVACIFYLVLFVSGWYRIRSRESLTIYALFRPELSLSQRNGLFSLPLSGLALLRRECHSTKFDNIDCLSNFVLFSAAVAGYVAASLSLGPLSPFLFCWLSEQNLSSRLSLSLLYTIEVSGEAAGESKIRNGEYTILVDKSDDKYDDSEDSDFFVEDISMNGLENE
ncbi:hypothetical protein DINM_021019 [Dirofilaria immitis]|nr:hypothetical protein [Dirofilaria immitis]